MYSINQEDCQDDIVRGTNDDATISRQSAAALQYLQDPFVRLFVKRPIRRSPIINRGTFIRNYALDSLVCQFLASPGPKKQIVSLGAGFDTRYFNLKSRNLKASNVDLIDNLSCYFEIDFGQTTTKKAMTIKRHANLHKLIDSEGNIKIEKGGMDLKSKDYCLLSGDLRDWSAVSQRLIESGLDLSAPTLFISECVFIYLDPEDSDNILRWITDNMINVMFVLYEQIKPDDAFGKMMIKNLKSRDIDLKGIYQFPELEDQKRRFIDYGWQDATAIDINTVHDKCISKEELTRIAKIEILDELEEWRMLSAHYCIAWAYKTKDFIQPFSNIKLSEQ
ncbi:leucine carboxyl methyltransferase [Rhizopus microsporus var. microsporus]|uniref:Leucine carboxyl methyltransferase 1 n=2 Tax=Rhizopus microsporus TaxID=58291 RepID=A0A2G4T8V4_RHIZD|nr:leucine carboxyl methyltransferase [Rhizopus microsporus ATCC 52813]ORE06106.1 leucine carboxyl methyltransferase [Rhizopus microsporus var. microsporus]PHZ17106.1 leucine carboxyl methyltransferase [Rhizopus microsporus ATCC 52813]